MVTIIGVRFKSVGKIYYFDPSGCNITVGDRVVVETARGLELGRVVIGDREVSEDSVVLPLKKINRVATDEDILNDANNRIKEKEAFVICNEKIKKHGLEMKLIEVEYTFDRSKILFYFSAEDRVDFRELVKDLACVFKTRIELRQIGVRDETKALGGIGVCGRVLCCHGYLPDFVPVSIKMAKEQNLPLNPTKISGVCGRLLCCLKYEQETYEWLNKQLPKVGDYVETSDGYRGEISDINVLRQKVKVKIDIDADDREIKDYAAADVKVIEKTRRREQPVIDKSEEAALKALEQEDREEGVEETRGNRRDKHQNNNRHQDRPEGAEADNRRPNDRRQDGHKKPDKFGGYINQKRDFDKKGSKPDTKAADKGGGKREFNGKNRGNR